MNLKTATLAAAIALTPNVGASRELAPPTIDFHVCGAFNYALVPILWPGNGHRIPAWAMVPVENARGEPLSARQASIQYWMSVEVDPSRKGRHFGVYSDPDSAHDAVVRLNAPCAREGR